MAVQLELEGNDIGTDTTRRWTNKYRNSAGKDKDRKCKVKHD